MVDTENRAVQVYTEPKSAILSGFATVTIRRTTSSRTSPGNESFISMLLLYPGVVCMAALVHRALLQSAEYTSRQFSSFALIGLYTYVVSNIRHRKDSAMPRKTGERREGMSREKNEERHPVEKKRRKPRGAILHGDDPRLAKRVEEELYDFGR